MPPKENEVFEEKSDVTIEANESVVTTDEIKEQTSDEKEDSKKTFSEKTDEIADKFKENIEKIDWDKVVYEDENKQIPLVTQEDIEIFSSITDEFIGDMDIGSWVNIAKEEINEYIELKSRELELEVNELSYLHNMEETVKSSKELLALIQLDSKNLAKDFVENKIAETAIKAAVIKTLRDFTIKRYPIVEDKDEFVEYVNNDISKHMYVIPIFKRLIEREFKRISSLEYNRFNSSVFMDDAIDYTHAISTYLKMLDSDEVNIDLSALIAKDFEFMNFYVITVLYSVYKKSNPDFVLKHIKNIDDKTLESLNKTMDLEGYFTSMKDGPFDRINEKIETLIHKFHDVDIIDKIMNNIKDSLNSDKLFRYWKKTVEEQDGLVSSDDVENSRYTTILSKIIENIPSIENNMIGEWAKYYRVVRVLNLYLIFNDCKKVLLDEKLSDDDRDGAIFNLVVHLVKREYDHSFSKFVTDFNIFIKDTINAADSRDIFFKTSMNFLNVIHSFGFKSYYTEEDKDIYKLAKEKMGNKLFGTTIVDESDDIVLKDVDMTSTKNEYYNLVDRVLNNLIRSIDNL